MRIRDREIREEAQLMRDALGIDIEAEMARLVRLRAGGASSAELRQFMQTAERLAADACNRTEKARQRPIPWTAYRVPCAAYEALVQKAGLAELSAAERLAYGKWLMKMQVGGLDADRMAAAFEAVLKASPTPEQEKEALLGQEMSLILAEQLTPGEAVNTILGIVETLRHKYPEDILLMEALQRMGDYYLWHQQPENARPFFTEAVQRFGGQASVAKERLQRLAN